MQHTATYANPHALVSTDWVAQHLDDPKVRLLQVDVDTTAYERLLGTSERKFRLAQMVQDMPGQVVFTERRQELQRLVQRDQRHFPSFSRAAVEPTYR